MKKAAAFILTAAFILLILSGCAVQKKNTGLPAPNSQPSAESKDSGQNKGITVNKIKFEKIGFEKLSQEQKTQIENIKRSRGYYAWEENGSFIIFIASGEKPTGGYKIDVKSIEDNEGITNILVEEEAPAPGTAVTEVITYPYVIVKAAGITDNFNIENTKGERFSSLKASSASAAYDVTGIYVGAIDSNFVEILVNGKPESFMITEVYDKLGNIRDDDKVIISYEQNEYGQLILKSIEKAR
ncbi:MAG: protease complex subunit PrcB family protein [Caulobacteraceae bacterium]